MRKSKKIAFCGMITALSVVIMLMAFFPYLTYALPAIAGALTMVVMIECKSKWAWGVFFCTSVLALLLCEKEAATLYAAIFGYYPIVKGYFEHISYRVLEYSLKFTLFNVMVVFSYLVVGFLFGIQIEGMGDFGRYTLLILLALGNVMFAFYDLALTRLYSDYFSLLHSRISRLLK